MQIMRDIACPIQHMTIMLSSKTARCPAHEELFSPWHHESTCSHTEARSSSKNQGCSVTCDLYSCLNSSSVLLSFHSKLTRFGRFFILERLDMASILSICRGAEPLGPLFFYRLTLVGGAPFGFF